MDVTALGIIDTVNLIKDKKITALEVCQAYIKNINDKKNLNAVIEVFSDAIDKAREIDQKIAKGEKLGRLAGATIIIKDNILIKGKSATCASKFLQGFVSPYDATVIKKLKEEDAILLARANMDEFAMGGSNENSCYGPCKNAIDSSRVAGGSSGGSAVSVSANLCCAALGTDTGGSIRQPSSYNGVIGFKPTYGRVSRYGAVAFASSLDQIGPITKTVEDNRLLLDVISGKDENDSTSIEKVDLYKTKLESLKGIKVGFCSEIQHLMEKMPEKNLYQNAINFFKENGAEVKEVSIKNIDSCLPIYYILSPAEAASNLGRFDGIKYTVRKSNDSIEDIYIKSRTEGFGNEVKRRIMLGNYVLSSGYYDAYYVRAKRLQAQIKKNMGLAFKECDILIMPTTPSEAFKIGEKLNNPLEMYSQDIFTIIANITEVPAISVPCGKGPNGLPMGLQILSKVDNESMIYDIADIFSRRAK